MLHYVKNIKIMPESIVILTNSWNNLVDPIM